MSKLWLICAVCILLLSCRVTYYEDEGFGRGESGDDRQAKESSLIVLNYKIPREDVDAESLQFLAVNLKAFNDLLQEELSSPRKVMVQMVMRLHKSAAEFEKSSSGLLMRDGGAIDLKNSRVHILMSKKVMDSLIRTHTFIYLQGFSSEFPPWVVEGFIEYFSDAKLVGGSYVVPLCSEERVRRFLEVAQSGQVRLGDVVNKASGEVLSAEEKLWAWALVYW
ncbi:MAG: hypothetical protein N2234_06445, partial [Planctomycetota bacterium]|nr:hypothetical protein [Planctomycetota bacterium]